MAVSIPDFWKLVLDSRLLTPEQYHLLSGEFAGVKGAAAQGNAKTLSQFLINRNALTPYQSTVLLAGRSGPFFYGDYKVVERIDQGRLAGLFRAIHVPTSHAVILQFLAGAVLQDPQLWSAMSRQATAHCGVQHVHLQRWHETVDLTSFKFLVGEDLRGESLEQRSAAGTQMPVPEACRVVRCAALALTQLHEAGLVHGDLRPRNLWFEPNGNIKLLRDPASMPTPLHLTPSDQANQLLVKSEYLAPELAQQGKTHDALTDIYALGCVFYQLLAGRPPFPGGDVMQKLGRHATERIQPLETFGVPQQIGQVVAYLMAKNPAVRFQQASLVADRLASYVDPASLYVQPSPPAPTFASYETWIAQRQTARSVAPPGSPLPPTPPAPPGPAGFPLVDVARRKGPRVVSFDSPVEPSPGVAIQVGPPPIGAALAAGPPEIAETSAVEISRGAGSVAVKNRPAAAKGRKPALADFDGGLLNPKTRLLAIGLGFVAVLALAAIAGLNSMGGNRKSGSGEATNARPEKNGEAAANSKEGNKPSETVVKTGNPAGGAKTPVETTPGGTKTTPGQGTAAESTGAGQTMEVAVAQQIIPDDGYLLWASPTNGPPVTIAYIAPGAQVIIVARPAEMLASGEGARVLASLGPEFSAARAAWEKISGAKFEEIEQIVIGLYESEGAPRPAMVVWLKSPVQEKVLLERWGNPEPISHGKGVYYTTRDWSFHIPQGPQGKAFAMGSPAEMKDVIDMLGAAPPLRREIERLRAVSDARRHATVFFHPNFLFNEQGQKIFSGEREKVRHALSWFLGDGLQAGMVSLHFGKETYAEVRLIAEAGIQKYPLATQFRDRLQELPALIENHIVDLTPPPYWKKLAGRYPQMINFLHQKTRVGVEDDQAVINAVLPGNAAHNLFAASELVIVSAPGAPPAVASAGGPAKPAAPKNIDEVLASKMSMAFAQDSLEFSMQNVAKEVKDSYSSLPFDFKVMLMGNDMKIDGITKNQSIRDFNEKDKTVAEILTAMVRKANPITTVNDPSELDQKLIWVVGPDPDAPDKQCILVTTRAAATKNGYKLPAPFVPKAG